MKIAITGKGGVGKTTLAASLAMSYAQDNLPVIAIDADPNANLAAALGVPSSLVQQAVPLSEMKELIEERTGAKSGSYGAFFKLNPRVDDLPEKYSIEYQNIHLLVTGGMKKGGTGCYCPENVLLKNLISHLITDRDEYVILDMEAGLEPFSRGTVSAVDALIIVTEPSNAGIQTARKIEKLAADLKLQNVFFVGNKITGANDQEFVKKELADIHCLGFIRWNDSIKKAEQQGESAYSCLGTEIAVIRGELQKS